MAPFRTTQRVLAVVLAGGRGQRLDPLTRSRSKPAVPFGAKYRIVDFVLSNLVNSGLERIYVLTQYKAQSLLEHLQRSWISLGSRDSFITAVPAQMKSGDNWYLGTADCIYQNLDLLHRSEPDVVAVFGADHVYKMNVRQMIDFHTDHEAAATVACLAVPIGEATEFGVVEVDDQWRIRGFEEKPANPKPLPQRPTHALVSMGNYIFDSKTMVEALREDAADADSSRDFGKNILPKLIQHQPVYAYDFLRNRIPSETDDEAAYWRDLGTIEAYFEANLDLKNVVPKLNLYNWNWPIRTASYDDPPAKFVFDEDDRRGRAVQSIVAGGCILSGGYVKDSVLGRNVHVHTGAEVVDSVILDNVHIGRGARIHRAIIDKNVRIAPDSIIGGPAGQHQEHFHVTESGIVVIPRALDSPEHSARNF